MGSPSSSPVDLYREKQNFNFPIVSIGFRTVLMALLLAVVTGCIDDKKNNNEGKPKLVKVDDSVYSGTHVLILSDSIDGLTAQRETYISELYRIHGNDNNAFTTGLNKYCNQYDELFISRYLIKKVKKLEQTLSEFIEGGSSKIPSQAFDVGVAYLASSGGNELILKKKIDQLISDNLRIREIFEQISTLTEDKETTIAKYYIEGRLLFDQGDTLGLSELFQIDVSSDQQINTLRDEFDNDMVRLSEEQYQKFKTELLKEENAELFDLITNLGKNVIYENILFPYRYYESANADESFRRIMGIIKNPLFKNVFKLSEEFSIPFDELNQNYQEDLNR